jgi:hypothetical protein
MKNVFFTTNHQTGSLSTGGFADLQSAQEYARRHNGGRNTIIEDHRIDPFPEAKRILEDAWCGDRTLTSMDYEILVRLHGLQDRPCGEHPSALYMALAGAGLLAKWDAEQRPRSASWFAFVNA